jgi:transcriptional regulator with XRE-family HTH domain
MFILSRKFITALKLHDLPAYRIAQMAGVDSSTLSKLINGISPIKENDERIVRIATVLDISADEAFDRSEDGTSMRHPAVHDLKTFNKQNTGTEQD